MGSTLWISTRKGAFALRADARRNRWTLSGPQFLGHIVHHIVQDPREPKVLLMAVKTGHLGPTVLRSVDRGRTWREASQPPAFRKAGDGEEARAVQRVFWLTPGHASESGTWFAGSSPAGLFRSQDGGERWAPVAGFNDHPMRSKWVTFGTPDGEFLHSILIDPRDPRHLYIGISIGGIFESMDGGGDWTPLNEGVAADFLPDPAVPYGHDPHCVALHPLKPDRLYHQNHCGLYRLDRPARRWIPSGQRHAEEDRRHRLSDRARPDRSRHRLGISHGRPERLAAHRDRRQAGRVPYARCGQDVAPSGSRTASFQGMVHGASSGDVHGSARAYRSLFRHDRRGGLGKHECRRALELHRPAASGDLFGHARGLAAMSTVSCVVRIASPLRSYTSGASSVTVDGATLHEILANLDRRFPGIRFRMVDEQDCIRPHMRVFVNTSEARQLSEPVRAGDTVHVICALSGG